MSIIIKDGGGSDVTLPSIEINNEQHPLNSSIPFFLAVSEGKVPFHTLLEKYGKSATIAAGSSGDLWNGGGIYTGFPTGSPETMEIRSSSTSDTLAGTGARTVTIYNLQDSTGASMPDITVNMSGTSWVSLGAQTYYRGGTRIKVITAGSGGENAGEITLRHTTTTANIFAVMSAGKNQTSIAAYTVPLGYTLLLGRINMSMSRTNGAAGSASVSFRNRPFFTDSVFNSSFSPEISNSAPYTFSNNGYYSFAERTDIKVRCDYASDNNTTITADFNGILIDNTYIA